MAKITGLPAQNVINNAVSQDAKPAAGASSPEEVKPAVPSADKRPHSGNAASFWRSRISPAPPGLSEPEAAGSSSRSSQEILRSDTKKPGARTGRQQATSAIVSRLLNQKTAIPLEWVPGAGPLPGTPDLDWNSVKPTGKLLGSGNSAWVVGVKAMRRDGPAGQGKKGASGTEVRLAAKILKGTAPNAPHIGETETADRLAEAFNSYRSIIDAKHDGKPLGTHPNLCEIYGIVTMNVEGVPMHAMLMEAIPGRDAKAAANTLRRHREINSLTEREYWGAIQYLCDGLLAAVAHVEKSGIAHGGFNLENILVRNDGTVKVIDYGRAGKAGDEPFDVTAAYMSAMGKLRDAVPAAPGEAKGKNLVTDRMLAPEEAQAVLSEVFALGEIGGQRENRTRPLPRTDSRRIANSAFLHEHRRMDGAGNPSSTYAEKDSTPPSLSAFLEQPNFKNYVALQQHYQGVRGREQTISEVLSSLPEKALEALKQEITHTVSTKGETLLAKGAWLTGLKSHLTAGTEDGIRQAAASQSLRTKQNGGKETAIEAVLNSVGKSIEDLRLYIAEAGSLFAALNAVSHPLTPVDWKGVSEVGSLTKFALKLRAEHLGRQQVALLAKQ